MNDMTDARHLAEAAISLDDHERQRCEVWTRVMGYHRPVASFNIGKQGEHAERLSFVATDCAMVTEGLAEASQQLPACA